MEVSESHTPFRLWKTQFPPRLPVDPFLSILVTPNIVSVIPLQIFFGILKTIIAYVGTA